MEIPQKPENWGKILKENSEEILDLIKDKEILKFVKKCNDSYVHWDKLRRLEIPKNKKPEHIWALIKLFRSEKYSNLKFNGFSFRYILLSNTLKKLHFLDKEAAGNIQIEDRVIARQGQERYIISSLMEEAIASSQLEGAATTRKVAKEMLRQNRKPRTYDEKMILNGYLTLKWILEKKGEKLTKEFLLEIQRSITKDTLKSKEDEGRFRDNNEIVVGDNIELDKVYHSPPDHQQIPNLIEELCNFANNDDEEFIHPIIKAIFLHFLIGYIHPFNDGNGRTARAVFYWYVISKGYWLFEYTPISRKILSSRVNYGLSYLYTERDENDLTYFIEYNLSAIYEALLDMQEYIKRKQQEQKDANRMVKELKDVNFRQASILKDFMKSKDKYFTIREFQESYRIVYETARSDLLYLTKRGYITMKRLKNKFVFMFAHENQDKINKDIAQK